MKNLGQKSGDLMTRTVGFLNSPGWAGLVFAFSLAWLIAAIYICYVNYLSTYYGIVAFFPKLDVLVIWAFVAFVQGSEFVIPFIESGNLHKEMAEGWKNSLRVTWIVVIFIDYITALIWFSGKAGITLDNLGTMFLANPAKVIGIEIGSLIFSIIFLLAEILVVLGMRSTVESGKKVFASLHVQLTRPAKTKPSLPEGYDRDDRGRPFRTNDFVADVS